MPAIMLREGKYEAQVFVDPVAGSLPAMLQLRYYDEASKMQVICIELTTVELEKWAAEIRRQCKDPNDLLVNQPLDMTYGRSI